MFEKEAEEYAEGTKTEKELEVLNTVHDWGQESLTPEERRLLEGIQDRERAREQGFKDGAEFGYNKANEWHYVKDGDLPKEIKEYLVYKIDGYGCKSIQVMQFNNQHCWCVNCQNEIKAWKEIVLSKELENV